MVGDNRHCRIAARTAKDKDGNAKDGDSKVDAEDMASRTFRCHGCNDHVHILESKTGFVVNGTLNHSGSGITPPGSAADAIMRDIVGKIQQRGVYDLVVDKGTHHELKFEAAFFEFTAIPNLCEIARFHCTTRPLGTTICTGEVDIAS